MKPPAPEPPAASPAPVPSAPPPAASAPRVDWDAEAEALCVGVEKALRARIPQMPAAADMAEIHALQSSCRDLLRRAVDSGKEARRQAAEAAAKTATLAGEAEQLKAALARARSDFLSYQQRASNDLKRAEELALRRYVQDLLPILDSLDLARRDGRSPQANLETVRHALELIGESLHQALRVRGLEPIAAAGQPFDPQFHEAVSTRPPEAAKGEAPNCAVEELRPGYLWKGLLLRPAQVMVTAAPKS